MSVCASVNGKQSASASATASSITSNRSASIASSTGSYSSQVSDGPAGHAAAEYLLRPDNVRPTQIYGKAHALYSFHADRNNNSRYSLPRIYRIYYHHAVCLFVCWFVRSHDTYARCDFSKSIYSVSPTPPPDIFWHFFSNGWKFLVQILRAYYTLVHMLDNKFLFICLQLWRSYAILSVTTIMCSKCPPTTETHAGWSHSAALNTA